MKYTLILVGLILFLTACTDVAEPTPAPAPELAPASAELRVEPEAVSTLSDAEAEGDEAAILYRNSDEAVFRLDEVPSGTYRVSVRAKAQAYKGPPLLRLTLNDQPLGEDNPVERSRYGEGAQRFGEATLTRGQAITATLVNDLYEGKGKDRNLIVDYLILEPKRTPDPAAIEVTLETSRALGPNLFGFNNDQTIRGVERDDQAYNDALGSLSPGTLRFPGGTSANYWDWERGDFVCGKGGTYRLFNQRSALPCALPNGYQALNPPNHSLENFKTELDRTGADAVFVLNMLTRRTGQTESNLSSALRMLKEAERLGIAVNYVELGNEFYLPHGDRDASKDYQIAFPNVKAYTREAQRWTKAVRQAFPDAQIAAVGADRRPDAGKRRNTWNEGVTKALAGQIDALSIHTYAGANADAREDTAAFLGTPQTRLDNLGDEWDALPQDLPLWITEYNLFSRKASVQGTWAHGLFAATQTLSFLQEKNVELMNFHSGVGNAVFGALFRDDEGFDYGETSFPAPQNPPATVPFARTASGQTLQLVGGAMRGATSGRALSFSPMPELPAGQPALVGWHFSGDDEEVVLLNLSEGEQTLELADLNLTGGSFVQRSADPNVRVTGAADQIDEVEGELGASVTLPAYSITRISR